MNSIKLLDTNTVNKIAAGEVVERPASCVKELLENSIDAGAKRIEIEILDGGKSLIRVTDDGIGMSREDAMLAIRRHATSKLSDVRDLQKISTLGFRGEALPTIAAVSKFVIQTRKPDSELGTKIEISGGKVIDNHEVGCGVGTTVIVQDLFFNTPARLKFLKTSVTEANKIHEFVVKLSLSRPEISFKFINGSRTVLTTPGTGNLFDTLTEIYGGELAKTLLEINLSVEDLKISGYIAKPNFLKSYRSWQTFIINGRVAGNRTVSKALDESYKSLIPKSGFPLAVLKIDLPQNSLDVNVHPQKTEVKFDDEGKIFRTVYRAIRETVSGKTYSETPKHDLTQVAAAPEKNPYGTLNFDEVSEQPKKDSYFIDPNEGKTQRSVSEIRELLNSSRTEKNSSDFDDDFDFDDEKIFSSSDFDAEKNSDVEPEKNSAPDTKNFDKPPEKLFPVGQVAKCYIIASDGEDLYIIDQHAAHERILFDRLSSYAENIPAQGLLIHRIIKFDEEEALLIENNLELFSSLGFTMEPGGENEFRLTEIPSDASDTDAEEMMREIISSLPETDSNSFTDEKRRAEIAANIRRQCIAVTACRAAIKAGHELNTRQMQIVLDDLSRTAHPHTCPHGRPTIIKFSAGDLAKMFKRT